MKKILINFVTLGRNGIDIPRLLKFKALNELGCELYLLSGLFIKKIELVEKNVYTFNETISELKLLPEIKLTKLQYLFYAIKMNIKVFRRWKEISDNNFTIFYSPAAVLDLTLFPYFYKLFHKEIKWIVVFDNIVPFQDPGNKLVRFLAWIFFKISLFFFKKADQIFVISNDLRDYLIKKRFERDKIILSANGVDNNLIQKAKPDSRYKIDALFMGRINETKGIYDMLEVLRIVKQKYPYFQFAIMGEGDKTTKRKFKNRIKKMRLENNVQFLGFRSGIEKFNIIKSAKCFWFLSVSASESFGVSLLEAVCLGIPCFTYDLPQFPQIYSNGEVDISPKGNYKVVAEKVLKLFEKKDFSNEKGKLLLGKYSWDKVAQIEYDAIQKL